MSYIPDNTMSLFGWNSVSIDIKIQLAILILSSTLSAEEGEGPSPNGCHLSGVSYLPDRTRDRNPKPKLRKLLSLGKLD